MGKMMKKVLAVLAIMAFAVMPSVGHAACTQGISNYAKGGWLTGMFHAGDTYKIAFYTDSATYTKATAIYAATNEVSGSGYSAGGFTLDTLAVTLDTDTYYMDWADEVNNTITFAAASTCAMIYDDTTSAAGCSAAGVPWACCTGSGAGANCVKAVLGVFTFTSIQPTAGTLTVTFPAPAAATAIIRIAKNGINHLLDFLSPGMAYAGDIETPFRRDETIELTGVGISGVAEIRRDANIGLSGTEASGSFGF